MRASRCLLCIPLAIVGLAVLAPAAQAQPQTPAPDPAAAQALRQQIEQLRADFEARISALEARLAAAGGAPPSSAAAPAPAAGGAAAAQPEPTAQVPAGAEGAGGPSGALPLYGGSAGSKVFNPDMAVIGDFLGATGRNTVNPAPSLQMHESEASFQAILDPYARADFFISFGEEGVDLEEGFATFPTLPGGILMKVGKMRASFGKINPSHNHILPWADRPLVTDNLVGGEEGIGDAGISIARLIPNKWIFLEATGQVFRGDSGDLFHASRREDVSLIGRLRGYGDLSESTNLDVGASYARGHNASGSVGDVDLGRFRTELFGVDATLRWKPLQRSIYHSFIARSEAIVSRRDQPDGRQDATGFYVSGDYQLTRRWFGGVRYDASERATDASARDTGQSIILTYWPSEFSQIRGQLRRTRFAEGVTANEFLFQFQFSIGAHGAHPF